MAGTTSVDGLISGLNTSEIIDSLMAIQHRPITLLEARKERVNVQLMAFQAINAKLLAVKIQGSALARESTFGAKAVELSNQSLVTASAGAGTPVGTYHVTVNSIATSHQIASQGFADTNETSIGQGVVTLEVGDTSTELTIDGTNDTLEGLRDAINQSDASVTAYILNTGQGDTPYQLIVSSTGTGTANELWISHTLAGGTAPDFVGSEAEIGAPDTGGFTGTSTPTMGGAYTGSIAKTYTFAVQELVTASIGDPDTSDFSPGTTSTPTMGGTYTGTEDKGYTFSFNKNGTIGSTNGLDLEWDDGAGNSGSVHVGRNYTPGDSLTIAEGITVSMSTGDVVGDDSFTSEVIAEQAGIVGSDTKPLLIQWDDGQGNSGSFDVGSGYTPDGSIEVADGITVAFSAGDVNSEESFTVDVTPLELNTIQAAQDASISFGSAAGGGTPVTITSSSNTIEDVIPDLTLSLHGADPSEEITIAVTNDTTAVKGSITNFVSSFNAAMDFIDEQIQYDATSEFAGPLLGDSTILRIQRSVRRSVVDPVEGLPSSLSALFSIGITLTERGRLSIDEAELNDALASNLEGVAELFKMTGACDNAKIDFLTATSATQSAPNGYDVDITQAATQGILLGASIDDPAVTPIVIDATNNELVLTVDGRGSQVIQLTAGTYASGEALAAELEAQISADPDLGSHGVTVRFIDSGATGQFEISSLQYGSDSYVILGDPPENSAHALLGLDLGTASIGTDVAGTINGESATGSGQILRADADNSTTAGIQLLVGLQADEVVGGSDGLLRLTKGVAQRTDEELDFLTNSTYGLFRIKTDGLEARIETYEEQIERQEERLADRRTSLELRFVRMEQALAVLQSEGDFLSAQLQNLMGTTTGQQ